MAKLSHCLKLSKPYDAEVVTAYQAGVGMPPPVNFNRKILGLIFSKVLNFS